MSETTPTWYHSIADIKDSAPNHADRTDYPPSIEVLDVARLLGVSCEKVRRECRKGTIKAVKFGGTWVINTDALFNQFGL